MRLTVICLLRLYACYGADRRSRFTEWGSPGGADRRTGRLGRGPGAGFGEDPVDVGLHGRVAEVEALGDLGVAQARGEEGEYLGFTGGEPIGRFLAGAGWVCGRRLADDRGHEAFLDGGVKMGLAGVDRADRGFDLLGAGVLGQVTPGPRLQRREDRA